MGRTLNRYVGHLQVERPIIKKLTDNLAVANSAKMDAQASSSDYAPHTYGRPIVAKLHDTLKMSGAMTETSSKVHPWPVPILSRFQTKKKLTLEAQCLT